MKKTIFVLLLAVVLAAVGFAGGSQEQGSTLVYGTTDKVTVLDTADAYDFHTWELFQNIDKGLLMYEPGTAKIVPALAESYSINPAGDQYTFKLRRGLAFSSGKPFNAQAVKWSIDRVMALKGDPSALVTQYVNSVDVVDDYTVRFNLKFPNGYFPSLIATPTYFPLDPSNYPVDRIIKDPSELPGKTISGMGPYVLTSYKRDEEAVLTANPRYWGPKPKTDRIIIRYFADATTMRLALESGDVDLVYKSLNPSDIKDLQSNPKFVVYPLPGLQIRYICFETSESVFKDKVLRQAVAALVNRPEVVQKVYLDENTPLYSMIPKGMDYHTEDFKSVYGDGNVQKANQLLQAAGYSASNPFTFDLWSSPSHYGDTETGFAEVLKNQLEKSPYVKVNLKTAEWATYKDQWDHKQMPIFLLGWYPDYIDSDDYTSPFAQTEGSRGMGIFFSNPQWDALFVKEQSSPDPKVRGPVFEQLQKMWTDEVPTVPIFQGNLFIVAKPSVKGVNIGPTLTFNYDQVYIQ